MYFKTKKQTFLLLFSITQDRQTNPLTALYEGKIRSHQFKILQNKIQDEQSEYFNIIFIFLSPFSILVIPFLSYYITIHHNAVTLLSG